MKIVYLGTSAFAAAILQALSATPHRPALVVSRPDSPAGRGRKLTPPPAVTVAHELGIDTFQPDAVNDPQALERIAAVQPQVLVVCAYGALIKEPLLSQYPILNVHPSLLPRWRGAAPIERAILAGDGQTGVAIMKLTAGLDSGPVSLCESTPIQPDDDYGSLAQRLQQIGSELLIAALDMQQSGTLEQSFTEQREAGVTYAEKLKPEERRLQTSLPAAELARKVRALSPHIGAYLPLGEAERLGVWEAREVAPTQALGPPHSAAPAGTIVSADGDLLVACGEPDSRSWLQLVQVQPAGKRRMGAADYTRGLRQ